MNLNECKQLPDPILEADSEGMLFGFPIVWKDKLIALKASDIVLTDWWNCFGEDKAEGDHEPE